MAHVAPQQTPSKRVDENGDAVPGNWKCLPGSSFTSPVASPRARAPIAWRIRDIDLVFVIKSQLWATAIITLIPVAMLGVIHFALIPRKRPFAIYDATISYPLRGDTIPALVAIIIPFILMLISLFVGEFILFKKVHRNITMAVSTALHFFIDMVVAFLFTIFMTELSKVATGVLRPDFLELADCQPATGTTLDSQPLAIGVSGTQALEAFPCRASEDTQNDARQAFVSGHASTATVFAFYNCGSRRSVMSHVVERGGKRGAFLKDLGHAVAMYWVLIQICFGWGIGISRIIDNKHGTADVVGGFLLGAMFGLVFVLKAIPTAKYVVGRGPVFEMCHSMQYGLSFSNAEAGDVERGAAKHTADKQTAGPALAPNQAPGQATPGANPPAIQIV